MYTADDIGLLDLNDHDDERNKKFKVKVHRLHHGLCPVEIFFVEDLIRHCCVRAATYRSPHFSSPLLVIA